MKLFGERVSLIIMAASNFLRRRGIRRRLMVWGFALLGTALALNTVASSIYSRREVQTASAQLQAEVASATARQIRYFIARKIERLQDNANAMSLYSFGSEEQRLLTHLILRNDQAISEISVVDQDGMERLKLSDRTLYLPSDNRNETASASFREGIQGRNFIGQVLTSARGEPYLTMAVPIKTTSRKIIGVLAARVDLIFLWEQIGAAKFSRGGYAYLVNESGLLIAHPDPSLILKSLALHDVQKVRQFLTTRAPDNNPGQEVTGMNGTRVLSSYAPIPDLGWSVVVEEPVELALAGLKRLRRFTFLLLLAGLLLSAAVVMWVSKKITRPIQELRQDVATIGAGNIEHRADIKSGDEIEDLAVEFNKMTDALQNSYATLEQKVERRTQEISAKTAELKQMNQALQEASQAKTEFIAAMSHEFRTPINVILGNAELTGDSFFGEINADQKNAMTKIRHHGEFLLKLVNDVLALSRLDVNKMSLDLATVNINEIVTHSQSHIEQLNRGKGLQVFWNVEPGIPNIVTDATKLEGILQNLIGNAFKFTGQGRIDIRIRNLPEQSRVEFCVADTGIGIETDDMDRIFRAFEQIKDAHTGEYNGIGLGLSIVKKYLDLMNGDIRVESRPGEGSTFTFSVPQSPLTESDAVDTSFQARGGGTMDKASKQSAQEPIAS